MPSRLNYVPSASEVLDLYWKSWSEVDDAKPLTMRDIMTPVLAQRSGVRPARMYDGERLIGF